MARRRILRPEEEEIWRAVTRTITPMHRVAVSFPSPDPLVVKTETAPQLHHTQPRLPLFGLGEKARVKPGVNLAPTVSESLAVSPLQMDAKTHGKMTRGKLSPEARIDLHGLTLAEAHPDLIRFILNAQSAGLRLVLVITGKGKLRDDSGPIPQRTGALRHQVPQWLRMAPLGPTVLQVTEAHLKHGGSGAYYVYLRRR
jgi:DNA-nicking Smr family endonuclease